ncbi:hypothetical protein [Rickettsiella endosymbiont of Miltochrista miniata]|uniref:hypothetical protein n=1 Tax=Rickettsiella endosymbiont of Miltochrista miniata TaxID=3066239 RepID=UPI00313C70E3
MSENVTMENLPNTETNIGIESVVPVEKTIPQSVVDNVVKQAKHHAYEQGKKAAKEELAQQQANIPAFTPTFAPLTTEDVQSMIANHTAQQANEWQAQQIAQQFLGKLSAAKDKYPDFEETLANLEVHKFPEVVQLANNFDNTADIMYELGRNPSKAVILKQVAQLNPKMGALEIQRLSDSIKQNQSAKQIPSAQPPLSQLTPSITKATTGRLSLRELKEEPNFIF